MRKFIGAAAAGAVVLASLALSVPQANAAPPLLSTRKGVILVTTDPWVTSWGVPIFTGFGHSAIIYSTSTVVEAVSKGVVLGSNNWNTARKHYRAGTVRTTTTAQDAAAADWAHTQIGKPYNYNFYDMNNRNKFYCSQLVWAAFKDKYGIDLNTSAYVFLGLHAIAPTELLPNNPKTIVIGTQ